MRSPRRQQLPETPAATEDARRRTSNMALVTTRVGRPFFTSCCFATVEAKDFCLRPSMSTDPARRRPTLWADTAETTGALLPAWPRAATTGFTAATAV